MLFPKLKYSITKTFAFVNILSLDAPLVVLSWMHLVCLEFGYTLNIFQKVVFFLSVWLAYSSDRYFENYVKNPDSKISTRHLYLYENQVYYLSAWSLILIISVYLTLNYFLPLQILICTGLLSLVLLNQLQSFYQFKKVELIFPKNIRTSVILSLSCFCFCFPFISEFSLELIISFIILTFFFWLNCFQIKFWEVKHNNLNGGSRFLCQRFINFLYLVELAFILYLIISFDNKFIFFNLSITLTICMSYFLNKFKICFDSKRIFLDQIYWVCPLIILTGA